MRCVAHADARSNLFDLPLGMGPGVAAVEFCVMARKFCRHPQAGCKLIFDTVERRQGETREQAFARVFGAADDDGLI